MMSMIDCTSSSSDGNNTNYSSDGNNTNYSSISSFSSISSSSSSIRKTVVIVPLKDVFRESFLR